MSGLGDKLGKTLKTLLSKLTLDLVRDAILKSSAMKPFISPFRSWLEKKGKRK